jgi:serine/threonine protein kinase
MLVLEDPGGELLEGLLGQPMAVGPFLHLALGLIAAIARLHQRGLIHKDIKPAHILVDRASGAVHLSGFGIASRLPRQRQAPDPPAVIAGTLAYMAPEQTGRMNRSIDARSDLYAVGVTLYQMLTGSLPFAATEPMEWVHCHIARRPVPPAERLPGVPAALSAIIMKLLAKMAEERYQTAAGLSRRPSTQAWPSAEHEGDAELAQDLLTRMAESHADFTLSFRLLCAASADTDGDAAVRALFADGCAYDAWAARWRRRMTEDIMDPDARRSAMEAENPAYIPRNHLVEAALDAAVSRQDFAPFEQLLEVLSRPFEERPGYERYAAPPALEERVQQTFCGT